MGFVSRFRISVFAALNLVDIGEFNRLWVVIEGSSVCYCAELKVFVIKTDIFGWCMFMEVWDDYIALNWAFVVYYGYWSLFGLWDTYFIIWERGSLVNFALGALRKSIYLSW